MSHSFSIIKYLRVVICIASISFIGSVSAQQTIGVFQNSEASFNGYTLFSPDYKTYLIDNCGRVVNEWQSNYKSGVSVYLLENGDLLRTSKVINSQFGIGGSSGRIERFSWEGDLEWTYIYSNPQYHAHHDIEPLPNGNILILAWENRTANEAIAKGRQNGTPMWPDRVVEIAPQANDLGLIVWTWSAWDHLVQDVDMSLDNYGIISDHPELLDVNFYEQGGDWMHCNSIDYNESRDEIILSSRHFSEVFIIDHSTTTAEAASHSGGNSGMGGDIIYRWGNPANYDRGDVSDQVLFGNHDARWVSGGVDEGKIMVFNNANPLDSAFYSSVEVFEAPLEEGQYEIGAVLPFGPEASDWTYTANPLEDFSSGKQSGAMRLPNENTLITDSGKGRIFEVNLDGNVVWDYQNPVQSIGGPAIQGTIVSNTNIFRAVRYAPSFAGFDGKNLEAGALIEIDDNPMPCEIYADPNASAELSGEEIFPTIEGNIVSTDLIIQLPTHTSYFAHISNSNGQIVTEAKIDWMNHAIDVSSLTKGIFFLTFINTATHTRHTQKFIKQ